MRFYKVILSIMFLSQLLFGQNQWTVFNSINSPLIHNRVLALKHDKNNDIWIGTDYGLYKYDGYLWNYYNTENSGLPSNSVNYLVIDPHNNLWFMVNRTNYPYFIKFDGENWTKTDTDRTCLQECVNSEFAVDANEVKWVAGNKVDGTYGIIRVSEDSCTNYVTEIDWVVGRNFTVDYENNFWYCADWFTGYTGVAKFSFTHFIYFTGWSTAISVDTIYSEAWCGEGYLLGKLDFNTLEWIMGYSPGNFPPRNIYPDQNYRLWLSSDEDGIARFDRSTTDFTYYDESNSGLPSDSTYSIAIDDTCNIWIATENGLAVFNESGVELLPSVSSRDTIDFDTVAVNSTLSQSYIVRNPYSTDIMVNSIELNSAVFTINDTLPVTITPGDSIEFTVEFSPDSSVLYENKLTLKTNKGMKSIYLFGYGKSPSSVDNKTVNPGSYYLFQNYPNPFNSETVIRYSIPLLSRVQITVYDILGIKINTLIDEEKPAGTYKLNWDSVDLPSGVYFYRIKSGDFVQTKKMILLK